MTRTSAPASRSHSTSLSSSTAATLRAVGPSRDTPQSLPSSANSTRRGSPAQQFAEARAPSGYSLGPEYPSPSSDSPDASASTTLRQQEPLRDDWGNPAFIAEKVTSLDRRLSTVSGLVQQQQDNNTHNCFSALSEVAGEMKADFMKMQASIQKSVDAAVEKKLAGLREQIKADGQQTLSRNAQALRQQMKADQEEIIQQSVMETLGAMSISMTELVQTVAALNKDVHNINNTLKNVESTSANVLEELNTSVTHAQRELGFPTVEEVTASDVLDIARDDNAVQLRRLQSGPDASSTLAIHSNTSTPAMPSAIPAIPSAADAVAARVRAVIQSDAHAPITLTRPNAAASAADPDVPSTPTAPETPTVSDTSSTGTGSTSNFNFNAARAFLDTVYGAQRLYALLTRNKRRRT